MDVFVPSPADRVALAIAHGGLDAHTHSDWLVDSAMAIRAGDVDWDVFCEIAERRRIAVPAAVALTYLQAEMSAPVPPETLKRIVAMADRTIGWRIVSLLQAKPRTDLKGLSWLSRGVAKQLRMHRRSAARYHATSSVEWRGRRLPRPAESGASAFALLQPIALPPTLPAGGGVEIELVVKLDLPPVRRRIEMELNGGEHHFARLRYRKLGKAGGEMVLRFRGRIRPDEADGALVLVARPSRQFREWENSQTVATYGALPFQLVSVKVAPGR